MPSPAPSYNTEKARVADPAGRAVPGFKYAQGAGRLTTAGEKGGVLGTRMFENAPILKYTGPVADRLIGGNGLYYKARTLLATPYAYGPVRVAGTAVGQAGVMSAKIRATAATETAIGGQKGALAQAIDKYHNLDYVNVAMEHRLGFSVFGHHVAPGLDTLAWFLHPPLSGVGQVSAGVGADVAKAHTAGWDDAFGPSTGYAVSIERGVNVANRGKGGAGYQTFNDLVKAAGGKANFDEIWLSSIAKHAAGLYADNEFSKLSEEDKWAMMHDINPEANFLDETQIKRMLAHEALMSNDR